MPKLGIDTEKVKWYVKHGLILLIVIIIAIVSIQKCTHQVKERKTERVENNQVVENTHKSDSLEAVVTTLQSQLIVTKVKDSIARIASNRLISYWKNKSMKSRVRVDTLVQTNPYLKEAFEDSDSLLAVTEARNKALEKEKAALGTDMNRIIFITEEQLNLERESKAILAAQVEKYKKKSEKRFSVGPIVGFDYKLQPTFGIGLQYRLFRF